MNVRARYLVTTLLMAALAIISVVVVERPAPPVAARVARSATTPRPPLTSPPTAQGLLARQDLALTPSQRARLEALAAAWNRESAALNTAAATAQQDVERFMRDAHDKGPTSLDEIRRRSEEYQSRSTELRLARQRHAADALAVLDEGQRMHVRGSTPTGGGIR